MNKTLFTLLRLTMFIGVLVLVPSRIDWTRAQVIDACQTFTAATSNPCPDCCTMNTTEVPEPPFSTGAGTSGLQAQAWSCGTAVSSGCSTACSGTTYVEAPNDAACCLVTGQACSITAQCCGTPGDTCTNSVCTVPPPPPPPHCPYGCSVRGSSCFCPPSPVILDLDGKGFDLTSAEGGVRFDIEGNGSPEQMGWTAQGADNAFLALPGADGLVHNGKELFGNFTPQPPSDNPNGFAALAVFDLPANGGNGDGIIDSRDLIYPYLRLWIDTNHDGICQPEEMHTLASLGVVSISLNYRLSKRTDQYGNLFRYKAPVDPNDPDPTHVGRKAYDVFFVTANTTASAKECVAPPRVGLDSSKEGAQQTSGKF